MNDALTLDGAVDLTRTGDLWLFRGRTAADRAIRTLTNSPVNHVGMAVVIDDLPPLMWHAELSKVLTDVWTGGNHRGVQLHDLRQAVDRVVGHLRPAGVAAPAHPRGRATPGRTRCSRRSRARTGCRSPVRRSCSPDGSEPGTPTSR
ncbi:hypothetical protein [Nocardioides sp. B-3]|uniref:hypothetical protein n=1 Tax=Nocardioides sp. B-3 TaxID=2895565 RepID=UPI0021527325|nr:hypothetical protein [Nocardioides sp. B-3]UUZ61165.1 hypothetical protein LP418_11390 [Nocardioides sp. B-3]